jgi:hypothetical protein
MIMGIVHARICRMSTGAYRTGAPQRGLRQHSRHDSRLGPVPAPLRELAEFQHGALAVRQLVAFGLSRRLAEDRVRVHRWQRVHRGVYVVFTGPLPRTTQVWAAVLRAGPGAAASHVTAAELDGLCARKDERIHVTAPVSRRVRGELHGMVVHYAHRLAESRHPSKNPPRTRVDDTVLDLVDISDRARDAEGWVTGHQGEGRFRDRRRDNRAAVDGVWTLRYGFAETFGSPCEVAAEVALVLRDRGWTGFPRLCGPACLLIMSNSRASTVAKSS